ncbi:DUF488 domain-containing protein [Streptomyces sp. NPDC017056]|uniref:DUF488 domain-containing protein n=1 Tax=Streptomyces sp. NPDC017056 TaxID=3364973 RepID=UPI0037AB7872
MGGRRGQGPGEVRQRRVYEEPEVGDGARVLVDRLWPRGVSKDAARLDEWCRDVAPSKELRTWYGHRPERYEEFAERYRAELGASPAAEALEGLRGRVAEGPLTLLTATKDVELSHVTVLAEVLGE